MEDSYETGKADLKGTDGRSGSMGDPGAGDSDDRIPAQAGSGVWTFGGTGSSCVASLAYVPPSGYCAGYGCDSCGEAYSGFCDEKISGNGGCSGVGHDTVPLHSSGWNSAWDVWNENICLYAAEDSQAYGVAQGFFGEVITMTDCDEYSPLCGGLHI